MITIFERSRMLLNLDIYKDAHTTPFSMGTFDLKLPKKELHILRMPVLAPNSKGLQIPKQLLWLKRAITELQVINKYSCVEHPYCYVTVRHGKVKSLTDDLWHVDGFSTRKPHLPEQNYIYTSNNPTEVLLQNFKFPKDFDPLKHNIHWFFQDQAKEKNKVLTLSKNVFHLIDPYIIHRRPKNTANIQRTFIRISFVPIQIEDDNNTINPLIWVKHFNNIDFRNCLKRYYK